nr:glycosyl hydrolase [uncultured Draconibacterium sp.]
MKHFGILILLSILLAACSSRKDIEQSSSEINNYVLLKDWFVNPPSEYRSAPLWDWNDLITKEGISFQMEEFNKAGIGGVFVHPRPGLITEYISEDWHQLFDYTVQKGKELGMKVWIYDENSYPSGFAGGHVPEQMPDSYQHGTGLSVETLDAFNIEISDTIEVVLKQVGDRFEEVSNLEAEKGKQGQYYVFKRTFPAKSFWYGGKTYVDLLYKGVTKKFMDVTMQGYEKYNQKDFGTTLPGIFTDEPNLEAAMSKGTAFRWTPDLWDVFKERWGYDLRINLVALTEEVGDWKKVRHDYHETLLEMFVDRWAKPWSVYCEENNLAWTGHYWEHGWPKPTHGFDEAAFYIWHQQPGVDMLGNELTSKGQGGQFGNARAVRELLSTANQAGRNRTLSETYGGGGWDMDFKKYKQLVDWQGVLGVNFVNQHLSYYSLKGVRKFDYPPSFSYHEPWWNSYKKMGDYIGRISMAMSAGEQINSTLVLQPNTSAWMYFSRTKNHPTVDSIQHDFKYFVYLLERKHIEYDLGSEQVLKTLGSINNNNLVVGKRAYDLVVIPASMENIDRSTFDLLEKYLASGGKVLSFTDKITRVDGRISNEAKNLENKHPDLWLSARNMDEPLAGELLAKEDFSIQEEKNGGELFHQRRILNDGQLLFFVNSDRQNKSNAKVSAVGKSVVIMDLNSGKTNLVNANKVADKVIFEVSLEPVGSAMYFVSEKVEKEPDLASEKSNWKVVEKYGNTSISPETDNVLPILYLDLKTPKKEVKDAYFMDALVSLFKGNGMDLGNPWQHKIQYKQNYVDLDKFGEETGFNVYYHFQIADGVDISSLAGVKAVVERPELWSVSINGTIVEKETGQYWIEKDFPIYQIGNYLKPGQNTITLTAPRMSIFAEVMPVYIVGEFKVQPRDVGFEITKGKLSEMGSWKNDGYIFYSNKVSYTKKYNIQKGINDFKVKLNKWNGTVAEVLVNNNHVGIIAFAPEELNITQFLKDGENEVTVRIVGSLKNTFGEFFTENKKWIYGPQGWNYAPTHQPSFNKYFINDYGLFEPFELLTSQD